MSDDLKPCPFCGGKAEHSIGKTGDGKPWHYVECVDCGATGPTPSYADHNIAVIECRAEAWNTRAERIKELEAKLAKAVEHFITVNRMAEGSGFISDHPICDGCCGIYHLTTATLAELRGEDRG